MIALKRVYDDPSPSDGERILVERLWPRGISKERAAIDLWLKDAAPSQSLRVWFSHDPDKWEEFQRRYRAELSEKPEVVELLRKKCRAGKVTFVYAASAEQNSALLLKHFIEG